MTAAGISRLGRYQLSRVLGQGAMGVVYEGLDPLLNRQVAVKTILRSAFVDADTMADSSVRFVREAQAIARLNHPNIVTVFDFGEEGDVAYFVMEFVRGRELKEYFDAGDFFALGESVRIVGELLAALDFAHLQGVVHRDVKPANVMLDAERRVKLTDFGVARLADSSGDRTMAGTMVGTPSYMSPEQIQGLAVGSRTDLFAVGIILYQCLTGTKPFPGPGAWAVQKQIVHDDPPPPSAVNPEVDPLFDEIVARALAKEVHQRYASAAEFAADLKRTLALVVGSSGTGSATQPLPMQLPKSVEPGPPEATISYAEVTCLDDAAAITSSPSAAKFAPADVLLEPAPASPHQGHSMRWIVAVGIAAAVAVAAYQSFPVRTRTAADVPVVAPKAVVETAVPAQPLPKEAPTTPPAAAVAEPVPQPPRLPERVESAEKTIPREKSAAPVPAPRVARAEPAAKVKPASGRSASSARCDDLMQRFQLGDGLSPEDLMVLQKECRK